MPLSYSRDRPLSADEFIDLLQRSTLAARRPVADRARITGMLEHANLLCTAWQEERLVGVARSVTDFVYCCYLSDLAVDAACQHQGIGLELLRFTQRCLHPEAKLILLAAPAARAYYPKVGMEAHPSAWVAAAAPLLERQPC